MIRIDQKWDDIVKAHSPTQIPLADFPVVLEKLDISPFWQHTRLALAEQTPTSGLEFRLTILGTLRPILENAIEIIFFSDDADITSENHPWASQEQRALIARAAGEFKVSIREASKKYHTKFRALVQTIEDATQFNLRTLYELGFDLRHAYLGEDGRLFYFRVAKSDLTEAELHNIRWHLSYMLEVDAKRAASVALGDLKQRGIYEGLEKFLSGGPSPTIKQLQQVQATLSHYFDNVSFPIYDEWVGRTHLRYSPEEVKSGVVKGSPQLSYTNFRFDLTNFPPVVRAIRDSLQQAWEHTNRDAWNPEWGPKPRLV